MDTMREITPTLGVEFSEDVVDLGEVEDIDTGIDLLRDDPSPEPFGDRVEPKVEEVEPEPEIEVVPVPKPDEPEKTSGTLVLKYNRSIVRRDAEGRIIEIVGQGSRKLVKRDEGGRIVEIIEEQEEEL